MNEIQLFGKISVKIKKLRKSFILKNQMRMFNPTWTEITIVVVYGRLEAIVDFL